MRELGVVKFFDPQRGWGFISRESDEPDVFVHFSNIRSSPRALDLGDTVEFNIEQNRRGTRAVDVVRLDSLDEAGG